MTEQQLADLDALAAAATPGPWEAAHQYAECWSLHGPEANGPDMMPKGDAAFIAAARTAVPALVAEVRRLREVAMEAFEEGQYATDRYGSPLYGWGSSDARKALDGAP